MAMYLIASTLDWFCLEDQTTANYLLPTILIHKPSLNNNLELSVLQHCVTLH